MMTKKSSHTVNRLAPYIALLLGILAGATLAKAADAKDADAPAAVGGGGESVSTKAPSGYVEQPASQPGRFSDRTALWQRDGHNLLSGFRNMYNFKVLHEKGAAYPFKAWFFGWAAQDCNRNIPGFDSCDAIFAARAKTLEGPWQVYAGGDKWDATQNPKMWRPVIHAQKTYYDSWHNGDPAVVRVGKKYYMAYSSVGADRDGILVGMPGDTDGTYGCIMGAVSEDGIHWRRSTRPILAHAGDFGATDSLASDIVTGGSYHRPSLMYENGHFRLWFDYWAGEKLGGLDLGYAENRGDFLDASAWNVVRAGEKPCLPNFPNPNVARVGDVLLAYSDAAGYGSDNWTSRKIVEAVSVNGLDWVVLGHTNPENDTPATQIPESFVQKRGKDWIVNVFYACQIGGEPYDYRYDRIRVMQRTVTPENLRFYRDLCRRTFKD